MKRHCLALALALLAAAAQAEIYVHRDAAGNPVFSDRPQGQGSQPVRLTPPNLMSSEPLTVPTIAPRTEKRSPGYQSLRIAEPLADETLRDNNGSFDVLAASEPALHPGHRYRLSLDGTAQAEQSQPRFRLDNVDRGTHQLTLAIVDEQGRLLIQSESVPVHVKRVSLAQRRLVQPCKLEDYGVRLECPLSEKPAPKRNIPFLPFM